MARYVFILVFADSVYIFVEEILHFSFFNFSKISCQFFAKSENFLSWKTWFLFIYFHNFLDRCWLDQVLIEHLLISQDLKPQNKGYHLCVVFDVMTIFS